MNTTAPCKKIKDEKTPPNRLRGNDHRAGTDVKDAKFVIAD